MNIARTCPTCGQSLHMTPWLDEGACEIVLDDGARRTLTPTQLEILLTLRRHGTAYVSAERLFLAIWGERLEPPTIKNLAVHIGTLREKLGGTGFVIQQRWGLGYRLAPE